MDISENRDFPKFRLIGLLTAVSDLLGRIVTRLKARADDEPSETVGAGEADEKLLSSELSVSDAEALRRFLIYLAITELRKNEYKTNDLVQLIGGFNAAEKHLKINGTPTIRLTKPEFVLLLILCAHGQTLRGLPPLRRIEGGKFLGAKEIVAALDDWRKEEPRLKWFWTSATYPDVHRTVSELRKKIRESGANADIIETAPKGEWGYRLSTSPYNITIVLQ